MNRRIYIPIIFIICSIFAFSAEIFGQNITKDLKVISGGQVTFSYNSIKEYTNGKSLNGWTRCLISYTDTTDAGLDGTSTGWVLLVKAFSPTIQSDGGGSDLDLAHLIIRATTTIAGATPATVTLTASNQAIVTGADPGAATVTGEIYVNFDCGTTLTLLGKSPDYYFVDLIFTLQKLPLP